MAGETMIIRKDAITTVEVPVYTVAHITDASRGVHGILLNSSKWFDETAAREFAQEESTKTPSPQRFTVYDPDLKFVCTFQCGQEVSPFVLV